VKTILTLLGIRPDLIRMSEVIKKLDQNFNHILVWSGQHYDELLSDVFFKELQIRKPDYNLAVGRAGKPHWMQMSDLFLHIMGLLLAERLSPDCVMFLGDSNTVLASVPLKKEGLTIAHCEAGMRSYDKRMPEEINRTICDHMSDLLFVYHDDYKDHLLKENIPEKDIYNVGNTIYEVCGKFRWGLFSEIKTKDYILMDIHRPENFRYKKRMQFIIQYAHECMKKYGVPVYMLNFGRTIDCVKKAGVDLGKIQLIDMMPYKEHLRKVYHSLFIISDSGTDSEQSAMLQTPVIVPRDFTERPQSMKHNCSFMIDVNNRNDSWDGSFEYLRDIENGFLFIDESWLGDGETSDKIVEILREGL